MLRITRLGGDGLVRLKLEGKLLEPWVAELQRVCQEAASLHLAVHLDLAHVTFVDASGTALLTDLVQHGTTIDCCSNFVAELLQGTKA